MALRFLRIVAVCATLLPVYAVERWRLRRLGAAGRQRAAGRTLRRFCTDLGATFIKVGQILSSRADYLPRPLLDELAELQDHVPPFAFAEVRQTIARELGRELEEIYERFDAEPAAAGSVSQVHRAVLRATGDDVAVKIRRPDVADRIRLDRSILLFAARISEWAFPSLRMLSVEGVVREFCAAVEGQLDFVREAESASRMRANFADDIDVVIPRIFAEASSRGVLTMEWLDGLRESDVGAETMDLRTLVRTCVRFNARAIFMHGFSHADGHPGNIRFRPPGRIVVYDFGLMAELAEVDRVNLSRMLFGFATADETTVAKVLYDQAPHREVASYSAYQADVAELVANVQGRPLAELSVISDFVGKIFDILRRHRLRARTELTVVYLALIAVEGIGKRLAPDLLMLEELLPYLAEALGLVPASRATIAPPAPATAEITCPEPFGKGRYRPVRVLGEGARKRVYLAHDVTLGRDVALAVLKAESLDPLSLARFRLEARATAKLGDHPGIVAVYDFGLEERSPFIVSEHMAGGTLAEKLESREGKPIAVGEALRIAKQICEALAYAHANGVLHRDVKPANVWLAADGAAKLGDFGLATATEAYPPATGRPLVGTVAYMAPEQALGRSTDARSDLYAFGCLFYEMLTGAPPFSEGAAAAIMARHLETAPSPPSQRNPDVPEALDDLVLHCLAKQPGDRPEGATAIAAAIDEIADSLREPATASPLERLDSSAFIGRDQEMKQLRTGLDAAFAGRGRLVLIAGEPGIGKTRLVGQLAVDARRRGARVLFGRCYEGEGAPAFWPWLQILRGYVIDRDPKSLESELGASAADVAQLVPEVRERLPRVSIAAPQEGEASRFRLFDAIARFLQNAAAAQPLVLTLDDLHWADKSSLLLLEFLAREIAEARLLVVASYRDVEVLHGHPLAEILPSLRRSRAHERIRLRGLGEPEVRELLATIGRYEMPADLTRTIHRETEGNPFFIEEIVSHLLEEGRLAWDGSRWELDRRLEDIGLPESVREVIGRRVARLSERCRRSLTLAAVIGREFELSVLEQVADLETEELAEALAEASAARVVAEIPRTIGRFRFAHALIRETLYSELRTSERVLLHRRIGETLESLHGHSLEPHLSELAHHFTEAAPGGDVEKAVSYAMRAAETAHAQLAFEEAARCYDQALKTLELGPRDELRRCRLLLRLGETRFNAGEFEVSKETFLHAAEIAEVNDSAEELALAAFGYGGLALAVFELTQPSGRLVRLLERSLAALPAGDGSLRAQIMARLAAALSQDVERPRRLALASDALAMVKRVGDPNAYVRVLIAATYASWSPDDMDERLQVLDEATGLARGVTDPGLGFLLETWRVWARADVGDYTGAMRLLARLGERPEAERGYLRWMMSLMNAARAANEGRFDDTERLIAESRTLGEEMRSRDSAILTGAQSIFLRWMQGRADEDFTKWLSLVVDNVSDWIGARFVMALRLAVTGAPADRERFRALRREDIERIPRDFFWVLEMFWYAEGARQLGSLEHAQWVYDLLAPFRTRGIQSFVTWFGSVSRPLGYLATMLGRFEDAERHFEYAIESDERAGGRPWVAQAKFDYAEMLALRGRPGDLEKARALVADAIDGARAIGMQKLLASGLELKLRLEGAVAATVSGSIDAVVSSLGGHSPDLRAQAADDGMVTLMMSDIEGFAALVDRLGDRRAHEIATAHGAIVRAALERHGGYQVDRQGDGFLVAFAGAERAARCAVDIQQMLDAGQDDFAEQPIRVRIGLHAGEVIKEGDKFFGKTVILAARIAQRARGGQILVSGVLRELLAGVDGLRCGRTQETELPGLGGTHLVCHVLWRDEPDPHESDAASTPVRGNVFRRAGDYWTVAYDGASFSIRDAKGLNYIARLLRSPGQEIHALDLARDGAVSGDTNAVSRGNGHAGELLDREAKAAYKRRLDDLREEIEEARERHDGERAAKLEEEAEFLTRELSAAYGLGGRARKSSDAAERARKAVQGRIADSISRIRKEHPTLAIHLDNSLRLGTFCVYSGDASVDWTF